MKKILISILLVMAFISACRKNEKVQFTVPDDYKSWKKPVEEPLTYPVPGHGEGIRIIYANDLAYQLVSFNEQGKKGYRLKDGAVVIKEVYPKDSDITKTVPALTIMVKDSNHEKNQDGWLYYVRRPEQEMVLVTGKMCIGCHAAANEVHPYFDRNESEDFRDYLFVNFQK